jgi:hypothetical protein
MDETLHFTLAHTHTYIHTLTHTPQILYDLQSSSVLVSYFGMSNGPLSTPRLVLSADVSLLCVTSDADQRVMVRTHTHACTRVNVYNHIHTHVLTHTHTHSQVFNVFTGQCVAQVEGVHKAKVRCIAFDDANRRVVAGSYDRAISITQLDQVV